MRNYSFFPLALIALLVQSPGDGQTPVAGTSEVTTQEESVIFKSKVNAGAGAR